MGSFLGEGLLVVLILVTVSTVEAQPKSILLNCGSNSSVNVDGRKWVGDMATDNNVTLSSSPGVVASTSTLSGNSIYDPLYKTARIFSSPLNYTIKGVQGNYFVRFHFFPFVTEDYNVNESSFGVVVNGLKLLSEFDVPGKISHKNMNLQNSGKNASSFFLVKEYILAVNGDMLLIEFAPTRSSFGFINAIEIVPVKGELFVDSVSRVGGSGGSLNLSGRAVETMYRLNVGGPEIQSSQDHDLWRTWEMDSSYMITENAGSGIKNSSNITYASTNDTSVAPLLVYETARAMSNTEVLDKRFNMSWKFEVDPDFDYLIRLHFCELVYDKANERIFRIYINNRTAANNVDIFVRAGGMNKAYHQDYFDPVSSRIDTVWVQLGPDTAGGAAGTDALLNGLEIFKLSRNGNLAYVERYDLGENSGSKSKVRAVWVGIGAGAASVAVVTLIVALVFCFCKRRSKESSDAKNNPQGWRPLFLYGGVNSTLGGKGSAGTQKLYGSVASTRAGKRFTLAEINAATNNFDESLVIGVGGFGKVYKGEVDDGVPAAIKRANPQSEQGLAEFETEIEMLSKLRHRHLVSLIGFCEEKNEMILVYEYMANGTLRSHLFGSDLPPLSWKQRLEVCIGAARGLHYLHTGAERGIIHRDVKTTNILLDENFVAKMADFGLSKDGPAFEHTHVSTAVKGSFGYLDPEYFRRQQLTEKSDVYSFGVVLFEAVCARAVINPTLPKDQINLAEWAMRWQRQRSLETIIDPRLRGNYCPESLAKFGEIAEKCLADDGKSRPTMGEVLWHLEYVLQLHEAWLKMDTTETSKDGGVEMVHEPSSQDEEVDIDHKHTGESD
ncbi:probable receptor-like protein kinase At1g30570 [Cajanus cajan]|uniref:Receptor-like protein kinase At1g30570 family n=1 Tax=Cajanus cajan TaxID=3821 RepID=A0A151T606_CAJCA|nr:probable receptor-like protein kinase At1g30570 [Cajanus cajan]KYP62488.1 putative receptor-like protein kinase At1g30570 family [Cajanus cajan]